jgi:ABC-type glycerol-3-phosphate transport system substrate-binding protein
MLRITIAAITILLAVSAAPAFAGKGGGTSTSSIAIASVSGGTSAATAQSSTARLGDTLTFRTTVEPLAGWEYPMVAVSCYQDVNGDGTVQTDLLGPDVVFTWLDKPSAGFTLGGYSSIWTLRGGGDAVCRADLDAYGWKRGKESTRVLATTGNWTAAG